jgi:hypothetical protein
MRDFGVPGKLADAFGVLLPLAELAIAIAFIVPLTAWWGAVGALCDRLFTLPRRFTRGPDSIRSSHVGLVELRRGRTSTRPG